MMINKELNNNPINITFNDAYNELEDWMNINGAYNYEIINAEYVSAIDGYDFGINEDGSFYHLIIRNDGHIINDNDEVITKDFSNFRSDCAEDISIIETFKKEWLNNNTPILCGFVWCHGYKDFSVYETNSLSQEDREKIEKILSKYETDDSSVRNCWYEKFSNVFSELY